MITILTVVCNQSKYIKKCIQSVQKNTFEDWEMLILDDRSRDNTVGIVKNHLEDKRIRLIQNSNKLFCGSAYHKLAKYARGDIVCVVDGDDMISKKALFIIHRLYKDYPDLDYIYTQHWICDNRMNKIKSGVSCLPYPGLDMATSWEKGKHCFSHMRTCRGKMLQYDLFKKGLKFNVDKYMGLMLESHGNGGYYPTPLYRWRNHFHQLTRRMRPERSLMKRRCIKEIRNYRKANGLIAKPIIRVD